MSEQIWSKELILEKIKYFYNEKADLNPTNPNLRSLVAASTRYFGSWREALNKAGINYEGILKKSKINQKKKRAKWSKDDILKKINELFIQEEDLAPKSIINKYPSLYIYACKKDYFGSWFEALKSAGIDYKKIKDKKQKISTGKKWFKKLILERIKDLSKEGIILNSKDDFISYPELLKLINKFFCGFEEFKLKHLR